MADRSHPAPQRSEVHLGILAFCLLAAPAIWGVRLVVNYGIDSYFCFPGDAPRTALPHSLAWVWPTLLALDLLTIAVSAAAAILSFRSWRATRHELASANGPLIEIGEGRTRFLSLWGLLIGIGFAVAVLFDLVGLWMVPLCG